MSLFKFQDNDIFYSQIKTFPHNSFFFYEGVKYYNNNPIIAGNLATVAGGVESGFLSLYELNVDRDPSLDTYNADTDSGNKHLIRPFVYKTNNSYMSVFKNISTSSFFGKVATVDSQGDLILPVLTGSYPLSASVFATHYAVNSTRRHVQSLKNIINSYATSPHFQYSSSLYSRNLDTIALTMLDIPSIFYGKEIKKGSVSLKFFVSGTLTSEINDVNKNGELKHVGPVGSLNSGSVCGIVLYNEGILLLTSSVALSNSHTEDYLGVGATSPKWIHFALNTSGSWNTVPSSSFSLEFKGTETIPQITMLTHAKKHELNYTTNLTAIASGSIVNPNTASHLFQEDQNRKTKNMVSSSFLIPTGSFERRTYISGVKIFDEEKKLIGVAKLSKPVLKKPERDLTIKIQCDM